MQTSGFLTTDESRESQTLRISYNTFTHVHLLFGKSMNTNYMNRTLPLRPIPCRPCTYIQPIWRYRSADIKNTENSWTTKSYVKSNFFVSESFYLKVVAKWPLGADTSKTLVTFLGLGVNTNWTSCLSACKNSKVCCVIDVLKSTVCRCRAWQTSFP